MHLKEVDKTNLAKIIATIQINKVTNFPLSNASSIPLELTTNEVVLQKENGDFEAFSVANSMKILNMTDSIVSLHHSGIHFIYTNKGKSPLWIPAIYEKVKDNSISYIAIQEFPKDTECITKIIELSKIQDNSAKDLIDKNVVVIQQANLYLNKNDMGTLSDFCNELWRNSRLNSNTELTYFN